MDESRLLAHIKQRSTGMEGGEILLGPGDDCAVLEGGLLVTVDQLVEGRHYGPDATLEQIAHKSIARAVSDIAAMGGSPFAGFASAALRTGFQNADELFDRMASEAAHLGAPLAGGDISRVDGPTVLSLTIMGRAHAERGPVLRSGARVGDDVCVTGRVGGAVTSGRHLRPEPRLAEATWLCDTLGRRLTSMIDLSDGLGIDASRVGVASGAQLEIEESLVPLHEDAGPMMHAIAEGEDYQLLFTVTGGLDERACPETGTAITRVGTVVEGEPGAVMIAPDGQRTRLEHIGWDHGT